MTTTLTLPTWATDANYVAGVNPWNGTPTKVKPTGLSLTQGATPGQQVAGQHFNWLLNSVATNSAVSAHAAFQRWSRTALTTTMVPGQLVGVLPVRGFDAAGERGRMPLVLGRDTSLSKLFVTLSADGTLFEAPRTIGASAISPMVAASRGAAGEVLYVDNAAATMFYSSTHSLSFASQSWGSNNKCAVHYAPGSTTPYLVLDNQGRTSNAATIAGLTTSTALPSVTTLASVVAEFADDGGLNVVIACKPNAASVYSLYHSADGGATYTLAATTAGSSANVTYMKSLGLFVCWSSDGAILVSGSGASWAGGLTTATTGNGVQVGYSSLAAVGPAICKLWLNPLQSGSLFQRGIAYSFDLGVTWNTWAFGDVTSGGSAFSQLKSFNGRLYALDASSVWVSGQLQSPAAEF